MMSVRNKKIFILIPTLKKGGAERVVSLLANRWVKNNSVTIILFNKNITFELNPEIEIISLDLQINRFSFFTGKLIISAYRKIKKIFNNESDPILIYGFLESANLVLVLLKKYFKNKITAYGSTHISMKKYNPLFRYIYKGYSKLNGIFVVSKKIKNEYLTKTNIPEKKLFFMPNPVNIEEIDTLSQGKCPDLLINLKKEGKIILSIGRLEKQKNYDLLIRSFKTIVKNEPKCSLVILGEGSKRANLERLIKKFGLEKSVFLPGSKTNPYKWLKNSDLFVLSSNYEGWPMVLIEAMVLKLPVIATDCPSGPAEILQNGKLGILVTKNNEAELTEAIKKGLSMEKRVYPDVEKWDVTFIGERYLKVGS